MVFPLALKAACSAQFARGEQGKGKSMSLKKLVLYASVATLALGAMAFSACGGDDDDGGSSSSSSGGTGSDEKFVADICKAGAQFSKDLEKASANLGNASDPKKAAEALADPFEDFAKAFDKAKPPKDLKDWHDQASKKLNEAVAALKKGDLESDIFTGEPFPDPPKEASDRLTKIAENNKDCKDADFSFGE